MTDDIPTFTVVRGTPTDEELAAVVVVLSSLGGTTAPPSPPPAPAGWSALWRSVRRPLHPGAGAWRMSGRG
jgi:hypothetical protein